MEGSAICNARGKAYIQHPMESKATEKTLHIDRIAYLTDKNRFDHSSHPQTRHERPDNPNHTSSTGEWVHPPVFIVICQNDQAGQDGRGDSAGVRVWYE